MQPDDSKPAWTYNPGDTIKPNDSAASVQSPVAEAMPSDQAIDNAPESTPPPQEAAPGLPDNSPPEEPADGVRWSASEYLEHQRGGSWYLLLILGAVVLGAIVYVLVRELLAVAAIIATAILVGVYAGRQPRTVEYNISSRGIQIGPKRYPFSNFRSFALIQDDAAHSIMLFPTKRFMPPMSAFFAPEDESKITDVLGDYLPFENHTPDLVDRLAKRLKF